MRAFFLATILCFVAVNAFAENRRFSVTNEVKLKPSSHYLITVKIPQSCEGREWNVIKSIDHITHKVTFQITQPVAENPSLPGACFEALVQVYYAPIDSSGEPLTVLFTQDIETDLKGNPLRPVPLYSTALREIN